MKKILVIAKSFIPPTGGAEISLLYFLKRLKEENYEIIGICYGDEKKSFVYEGIKVIHLSYKTASRYSVFTSFNILRWFLTALIFTYKIKPDLIITQAAYTPMAVTIAKLLKIPVIVFLRVYDHFCLIDFIKGANCDRNCFKCLEGKQKFFFWLYFAKLLWHRLGLKMADKVIANSNFMKELCYKWYKIKCDVIYPPIEFEKYIVKRKEPQYITFASTRKEKIKGYHIFIEIAKSLPQFQFLLVGAPADNLPQNVKYIGFLKDMREAFKHTKILLFPSLWPESPGRIAVEAMLNGIPVIYTDTPAVRETVNGAGIPIKEPHNLNEWIDKIKMLMEDISLYNKLSKKAVERAKNFDANDSYRQFRKILCNLKI